MCLPSHYLTTGLIKRLSLIVSLDTTALLVRDVICLAGRGCERPFVIIIITKEANIPYIFAGRWEPTSHLLTRAYFGLILSTI
jgi:hypothetical protein